MKDKTKKKRNSGQGIKIDQLLAAPFIAAVSANDAMARKQTAFLMESCFELENDDGFGEDVYYPKMVVLTLTKNNVLPKKNKNDKLIVEQVSTKFEVPILTLIPFNSLCVTDVSVKFDMEIISQMNGSTASQKSSEDRSDIELKGAISYDSSEKQEGQYKRSNTSKLSVEMNANSIPLPVGVTTILELYTKNISSQSVDKKPLAQK